ncbi:MAG: carbon starvation CstA family protein [Phycisphaerae bacterium]|jgi:carbon starvation protein
MNILLILGGSAGCLWLGARFYAPLIAWVLGERRDRQTPAVAINDGRDYVPTQTPVVFAHHYASIAGAGPIIGPVLAIYYGWGPALIWILLGGIFLGAVHDFVATHIAVREGGKNLAVVTRRYIGPAAFVMMLVLLVALLVLVCASFLDLSAKALTSMVPLSALQLEAGQTMFRMQDGEAVIGGIASTSVVVITAFSPLLGFLYIKRKTPVWVCSLLAMGICAISIAIGLEWPMAVRPQTWQWLIAGYVLIAAGLPVWLFLQSRDFINVHILYVGIVFLIVALIAAAARGGGVLNSGDAIPMNNWAEAGRKLGPGWPVLFVTIACGAVSGFHSLCAGGTTCKQLKSEPDARRVGFYAMLLESFLAVCVVAAMMVGLTKTGYTDYCWPTGAKGNPILTFAVSVGRTAYTGLGVPVAYGTVGAMLLLEGFLVTTLDTAIRLTRYMIEEAWATFYGRYDVFAEAATAQARAGASQETDRGAIEITGTGGLTVEPPAIRYATEPNLPTAPVPTSGPFRWLLLFLRQYWVNSGIAVGLMLLLALYGYAKVWPLFGSVNQLLAALTLIVATIWLASHRRPIWYTLLPALFMLATAVTMLIRELTVKFLPDWPDSAVLAVVTIIVLVVTAGIVVATAIRWLRPPKTATASG